MLAGSPLRVVSSAVCYRRSQWHEAHGKTTYPIGNFDKIERRTLESFNSLAGRMDRSAFDQRIGSSECSDGARKFRGQMTKCGNKITNLWFLHALHPASIASSHAALRRALGEIWPSSLTSSKRTETRFDTPDSSIVTP
jgi:hypothetical protein